MIREDGPDRVIVQLVKNNRLHNVMKLHCDLCTGPSSSDTVDASGTNEED